MNISNENEVLERDHLVNEEVSVDEGLANELVVSVFPNEHLLTDAADEIALDGLEARDRAFLLLGQNGLELDVGQRLVRVGHCLCDVEQDDSAA